MNKPITIEPLPGGGFNVIWDGRESELLNFGEMLDVVVSLTVPEPDQRHCLKWMRTKEQWAAGRARLAESEVRGA